ncbi:MAG: hypothetical protein ACRETL_00895 [Gammaproteobacteria bacterium]
MHTTHTLESKSKFERMSLHNGVTVQAYLSDNCKAFHTETFTNELLTFKQVTRFTGVGAYHHNGVAETHILTIMPMPRPTMLLQWLKTADTAHRPLAINYAAESFSSACQSPPQPLPLT